VCRLAATAARGLPDPIAQLAGVKRRKRKRYVPPRFAQSDLEDMLVLKPRALDAHPWNDAWLSHSVRGALVPRIVADYGGLDAIDTRWAASVCSYHCLAKPARKCAFKMCGRCCSRIGCRRHR